MKDNNGQYTQTQVHNTVSQTKEMHIRTPYAKQGYQATLSNVFQTTLVAARRACVPDGGDGPTKSTPFP